jgi:hypothetical protein
MAISEAEFSAMIEDGAKWLEGDIRWREDEDHSPAVEFRAEVRSTAGYPLFVVGRLNRLSETLSYVLVHKGAGRVYGLDLGADHHNPDCNFVGAKHKHRWMEPFGDKHAYSPPDITAELDDPAGVWQQFCAEANIEHRGSLEPPPSLQEDLPL